MTSKTTGKTTEKIAGETPGTGSDLMQTPLQTPLQQRLIEFLEHDLAIPTSAINLGLRQQEQSLPLPDNLLPMVLWQYGLLTIDQLDQVFEWLETA
jgi:hypothetical protein